MRSFFKIFFASLLAFFIFSIIVFFFLAAVVGGLASKDKPNVADKSILVLDLRKHFFEQKVDNPLNVLTGEETEMPGLYDVIRLIHYAKEDDKISGIYINANGNGNGFAASNEIRNALIDFKSSKKPIIAYGDMISEQAYFVASVANKIYANPVGSFEWDGLSVELAFFKGTLEKLNIEPQIFYAGKFKSATEPLRAKEMTPENKLQTSEWLGDLYGYFLQRIAEDRKIDTATLHALANTAAIQTTEDAVRNKLIDGVKYDDEIKAEWKQHLKLDKYDKMNFIETDTYAEAASFRKSGKDRVAVIFAEGMIVDGEGTDQVIGSEDYIKIIRKVRLDKSIKAIVFRVNSGGGSALASENILRELQLAKADKPVVVSFGDVAASGGYYVAVAADSIFASPNTITGSIGVFGIIPNMQGFFNDKLGVTFDGVKTAPYADALTISKPLSEMEKKFVQQSIDRIYLQFKQRVAQGRKMDMNVVDSIAQGRVWSGQDALRLGLVDKLGDLQMAIDCAARLAKTSDYRIREYPEKEGWLQSLLSNKSSDPSALIKQKIGEDNYRIFKQATQIKELCSGVQAKMPFDFFIH